MSYLNFAEEEMMKAVSMVGASFSWEKGLMKKEETKEKSPLKDFGEENSETKT